MFEEVRQALLVVLFHHGAGVDRQPQFGALRRLGVLADVVGEAVVELAGADGRIERQALRQIDGAAAAGSAERGVAVGGGVGAGVEGGVVAVAAGGVTTEGLGGRGTQDVTTNRSTNKIGRSRLISDPLTRHRLYIAAAPVLMR